LDFAEEDICFLEELVSGKYSQYVLIDWWKELKCRVERMNWWEKSYLFLWDFLIVFSFRRKNSEKAWMFEIVANNKNSVDVDKFDYLARDSYNCGVISSYDFKRYVHFIDLLRFSLHFRLMIHSRVINNEICYHAKEGSCYLNIPWSHLAGWNLNSLFHTRYSLFKQIYTHRTGTSQFFFSLFIYLFIYLILIYLFYFILIYYYYYFIYFFSFSVYHHENFVNYLTCSHK
jgi:hypothetical protein